jgi:ribose transport system ATP-binding protein
MLVDRRQLNAQVKPFLERIGADFEPDTLVAELSLAQRQLVEIVKALSLNSRLVIMDEPTSSLTIQETDRLMRIIAGLKVEGISVIFISHRLNEVEHCADRVVVLRDGFVVGALERGQIKHETMIPLMIGRDLKSLYVPPAAPPGERALEIAGVRTTSYPEHAVSLTLRCGEILGLAGLVGSGRTELARAIFGIDRVVSGSIRLGGSDVRLDTPRAAIANGIYLVPEDRKRAGLVVDVPIAQNISLPNLAAFARGHLVVVRLEVENAEQQKRKLDIRVADVNNEARTLSGGNQQKVVLAKWLSMNPRVLIFDEPTRGIDVGAKSEIYEMMRQLADSGVAIMMISSDMEEVIGVSDRIAVMHEGRISGFLERNQFSEHNVLQLAVGAAVN